MVLEAPIQQIEKAYNQTFVNRELVCDLARFDWKPFFQKRGKLLE